MMDSRYLDMTHSIRIWRCCKLQVAIALTIKPCSFLPISPLFSNTIRFRTKHEDHGGRKASRRLRRQNPSQTRQSKQKHTLFVWVYIFSAKYFDFVSDWRGDPEREDVDEPVLRDSARGGSANQRGRNRLRGHRGQYGPSELHRHSQNWARYGC
jgi:hypothetical protein